MRGTLGMCLACVAPVTVTEEGTTPLAPSSARGGRVNPAARARTQAGLCSTIQGWTLGLHMGVCTVRQRCREPRAGALSCRTATSAARTRFPLLPAVLDLEEQKLAEELAAEAAGGR